MKINWIGLFNKPEGDVKLRGRKNFSAFIICLLIAGLFWFLNALSRNYEATITFPVVYANLPDDKVLTHDLPQNVTLELNAQGFLILAYQFRFLNDSILIDAGNLKISEENGHFQARMSTANRIHRISRQLSPEVRIQRVSPDTIFFSFGTKISKEIPVRLKYDVSFEKQYRLRDRIIHSPPSVKVEGLEEMVDALEYIETDSVILKDLNSSVTTEIPLDIPKGYGSMKFSARSVLVTVPVEKYTEISLEIPIEVVNLPENLNMKVFPEKVQITCIVGFSDFDKVREQLFSTRVDYEKRDDTNRLPVEVTRYPEFVQVQRVQPQKVEYLIRKR